ncbi:MAG: 6-phosphogluconolactonase, partial [Rhizobiaceae bacterium]
MGLKHHKFASPDALADGLATAVAANLQLGIETRGVGMLAVSGGSTPKRFFDRLSRSDLDWEKVMVTLVDERWVAPSSDRSNAKLVRDTLLKNGAAAAQFVPLWSSGDEPNEEAIAQTNITLREVPAPFDAVILGMGNDGHTASFFPGGDALEEALTAKGPALAIRAPGAGEPRVTLTLPTLLNTRALYLHIEGAEKSATLDKALGDGPVEDMPVRAVLNQTQVPLD